LHYLCSQIIKLNQQYEDKFNHETNVHGTQDAGVQTAQPHASAADVGQKKL
jgi:hypothetical protein